MSGQGASDAMLDSAIALVGMSCRVPGAREPDTFWRNLLDGVESVRDLDRDELIARGFDPALINDPQFVARGAALDGMAEWDAGFFGFSPKEAAVMDPQIRHFLELSWEALERAGYAPGTFDGPVGVFGGCGPNTYMMFQLLGDPEILREQGFFLVRHIGNDKDFLATRVSYHLNLTGPGVGVQTACSTSLAAIHLAAQSLLAFECDMALAGGVTISFPHLGGYRFEEGEILSPDGSCRAFDEASAGTVLGDGGAVVVLRRLRDALADGDTIHAVIRGSAMNNDGSSKVGYLAPSVDGQARVIAEALAVADVEPDSIGYIEAHGTGTRVGDPIEVTALTQAFRAGTDRVGFCGLGSVKTNIGHLDTAAGVAGFLKAAMAVRDGEIPPSLHFSAPNPELNLEESPFRVIAERTRWSEDARPRRAGISSLGVGGTNVHVVLEEPPVPLASPADDTEGGPIDGEGPERAHLIVLSAKNRGAVERASTRLVDHLETHPEQSLADVAFTLQAGRARFRERRIVVGRSREEIIDALVTGDAERIEDHSGDDVRRGVVFLFAGGGAQYTGMAKGLYRNEPVFRGEMDRGLAHLLRGLGEDALHRQVSGLLEIGDAPPVPEEEQERPSIALPALFLVQHAQARLWMSCGITPSAMIGHSMGEYTAACIAGVLSMEEALELVVLRGRLFERVSGGGMLSVPLSEDELRPLLGEALSIAAVNGPELSVASGPKDEIDALEARLAERGVEARRVHIDVAAHSSMLEPILEPFLERLRRAKLSPPELPFASNLTGGWITPDEAVDPEYWVRQLRETVRFSDGLVRLLEDPARVLLEVGPGRTLATLARLHPDRSADQPIATSLRHPEEEVDDDLFLLRVLGSLWAHGVDVDWKGVHGGAPRRRVPLPTYPFERERHFIDPVFRLDPQADPRLAPGAMGVASATGAEDPAGWLHEVRWEEVALPDVPADTGSAVEPAAGRTLVVLPRGGDETADAIVDRVERSLAALPGGMDGGRITRISLPDGEAGWDEALGAGAGDDDGLPRRIVYAAALHVDDDPEAFTESTFFGLFELGRKLADRMDGSEQVELIVLTRGVQDGSGRSGAALVAGPVRVLPAEIPGLVGRWVDLPAAEASDDIIEPMSRLVTNPEAPAVSMIRDGRVLAPVYGEAAGASESAEQESVPFAPGDVCIITGGFGGVGLEVARHLASDIGARIVLLGRAPIPPRESWDELEARGADPRVVRAVATIRELEARGAEVLPISADVTDRASLEAARDATLATFGRVDAIFHAAGVLEDGLVMMKDRESASRVLAAKVTGTVLLDEVFRASTPSRFVLFSSLSAEAGLPGQVDYTAANAFLDTYARARNRQRRETDMVPGGTRFLSIGWSAWAETGMAVDAARGLSHWPLLDRDPWTRSTSTTFDAVDPSAGRLRVRLRRGRLWMLDEHRTRDGVPLIPGAGYLELVRAGLAELGWDGPFGLEDVFFVAPFLVPDGETRELELRLPVTEPGVDKAPSGTLEIVGRAHPDAPWEEHVRGRVQAEAMPMPAGGDDAFLQSGNGSDGDRRGAPGENGAGVVVRQDLDLGPRWSNVRAVEEDPASGSIFLDLELDPSFLGDLGSHALHPALLDNATALAGPLAPGFGDPGVVFVPASYGAFRMHERLPQRVRSRIRRSEGADGESDDLVVLDVTIADENGRLLAEADQFVLVRVRSDDFDGTVSTGQEAGSVSAVEEAVADGLTTEFGIRILDRALRLLHPEGGPSHLLVSGVSPDRRIAELREAASRSGARGEAGTSRSGSRERTAPDVDVTPIETALEAMEAVLEAAVTAHEDRPGELRFVAHVVLDPGRFATVSELRRHLRTELPSELVPQNFVQLDSLPRRASGEVNRGELHDPFAPVDDHVPPSTPTQEILAGVWRDLLGVERIGIHDNFLDVGGHSLLAMRAILRIEKETGVRIGPVEINVYTLEQIAAKVDSDRPDAGADAQATELDDASDGGSEHPTDPVSEPVVESEPNPVSSVSSGAGGGFLSTVRRFIPGS